MPEKLPVPPLESIQLLTQDVGSVFQGKMNSVVVALRNALIAFNAQIDAAETASQQVEPAPEDVALEGTNNTYKMTPLRSAQLIEKLLTDATADEAEALAGTSDKLITALLLDLVLEWRLGTAGNLGTAAQRNVMTSLTDTTTPDALMPRGAFGVGSTSPYKQDLSTAGDCTQFFTQSAPANAMDGLTADGNWWHLLKMVSPDTNLGNRPRALLGLKTHASGGFPIQPQLWIAQLAASGVPERIARVYDNKSIVGLVTQALGIPTGAIFEYGINAFGSYVKIAGGLLICWTVASPQSANTSVALGASFRSILLNWTFPATFANTNPFVFGVSPASLGYVAPITKLQTYCEYFCVSPLNDASNANTAMFAIGFWHQG